MNKFENINLSQEVLKAVADMGFENMSPIQEQAIPLLLEDKDIIGQAQTGTGKTAAFGIPIIEKVDTRSKTVQAMVLYPTRELTVQVAKEIENLAKYKKGFRVLSIYGGAPINKQISALKSGVNVVVGTPGRVMDHIRRNTLKLNSIETIVLDEADEMFDMGFRDDMAFIMDRLSGDRQTVFFSATMAKAIMDFAKKYQKNPVTVKVKDSKKTMPKITEYSYDLKASDKTDALIRTLETNNPELSIVFCNTKRKVDNLVGDLISQGYSASALHGDLKQAQRDRVMRNFRNGNIQVLVATDVAARGIDVDDIDMVFNYDVPENLEYYVHRIGRTGRAGREGVAYNFVTRADRRKIKDIQRYTKSKIKSAKIPSKKDVKMIKAKNSLDTISELIEGSDLSSYKDMIGKIEEKHSLSDISAALLKLYLKEESKVTSPKVDTSKEPGRIHINIGSKMGIQPRHIVAGIVDNAGINGDDIGKIDIFDNFSFVEMPENNLDATIRKLNSGKIKGKKVRVERANARRN